MDSYIDFEADKGIRRFENTQKRRDNQGTENKESEGTVNVMRKRQKK